MSRVIDPDERIVCRSPRAACKELVDGSGAVILHLETGAYHGLNQIGTLIWNLLEEDRRFVDLLDQVRQAVEDPPPHLTDEVEAFLEELQRRDLVVLR